MAHTRIPAVDIGISECYLPNGNDPFGTTTGWCGAFLTTGGDRYEINVLYADYPGVAPSLKTNTPAGSRAGWVSYKARPGLTGPFATLEAGRTAFLVALRDTYSVTRSDIDQLIEAAIAAPSFSDWLTNSYPDPTGGSVGRVADGLCRFADANNGSTDDPGACYATKPVSAPQPELTFTRMVHQVLPVGTIFPGPAPSQPWVNLERPTEDSTWDGVNSLASFKTAADGEFSSADVRVGTAAYFTDNQITTIWNNLP